MSKVELHTEPLDQGTIYVLVDFCIRPYCECPSAAASYQSTWVVELDEYPLVSVLVHVFKVREGRFADRPAVCIVHLTERGKMTSTLITVPWSEEVTGPLEATRTAAADLRARGQLA